MFGATTCAEGVTGLISSAAAREGGKNVLKMACEMLTVGSRIPSLSEAVASWPLSPRPSPPSENIRERERGGGGGKEALRRFRSSSRTSAANAEFGFRVNLIVVSRLLLQT
jgi:hypothetical protein